ncbi:unnamed protein product [Plutella xylostella]|uniref:(diamondback moth) hypothetical protein n=1 Tax=Plutella xylostella TaxID=51655 RepID=A0A8S4GFG4_PLUXY|nr:unnamed protein product [Plutella xylostella]
MASTSRLVRQAITPIKTFSWLSGRPTRYTAWNPVRLFSVSQSRDMKFVQFTYAEKPADVRVGYLEGDNVVDLNKVDSSISPTLLDILRKGQLDKVQKVKSSNPASTPLSSVKLQAPIHGMDKVLCIGLNYKDHCEEQNLTPPPVPMFFSKFSSTIIGPSDAVQLRSDVTKFVQSEGLLKSVTRLGANEPIIPFSEVTCKAPIHGMDKIICIGMNYKDHCQEINVKPPEYPMFFSKFSSTIIGPGEAVRIRNAAECVDWEVELVVVIGKKASNVQAREAYDYVFGYTVAQDISARDWQKNKNGGQFLLGKSMDTFCPIGPCIATADEVGDPQKLNIRCSVNGVLKQSSNTEQLVHKIPDAIERLTSVMTLLPGDIILTGTPGGVGMYRDPPEYLQPGHVVESEVEKIGLTVPGPEYLQPGHVVESEVEKIGVLTTRVEGFRVCANK